MSFADLKKKKTDSLKTLNAELNKMAAPKFSNDDDKFWYPDVDKVGNGYAVIRFLPAPIGEEVPFVRMFNHSFKGPTGKWYIENSLSTIGQEDPCMLLNSKLWNSGSESDKELARKQKRKLTFISNALIIKDSAHPENEGKVVLFRYGKKIFDKLNDAMNPKFEDEQPLNPFDLDEGADFKIKIRQVEGYRNYDSSEFASPSKCGKSDEEQEKIWKQCQSLAAFHAPSNFKTFDELQKRLNLAIGIGAAASADLADEAEKAPAPKVKGAAKPKPAAAAAAAAVADDDDEEEFLRKLAEE